MEKQNIAFDALKRLMNILIKIDASMEKRTKVHVKIAKVPACASIIGSEPIVRIVSEALCVFILCARTDVKIANIFMDDTNTVNTGLLKRLVLNAKGEVYASII